MKVLNLSMIILIILPLFIYGVYYSEIRKDNLSPAEINRNISSIEEQSFNLTKESIPYVSLYEEENVNAKNIITNIAHGITYSVVVEVNTIIPLTPYIMQGDLGSPLMSIIVVVLIIIFLTTIISVIKGIIILYFFIKEKKTDKTKWYE